MSNGNSVDLAKPQIKQQVDASPDATVVILAEVICVFAARGRALREERAKRDMDPRETVAVKDEKEGQNPR